MVLLHEWKEEMQIVNQKGKLITKQQCNFQACRVESYD